LHEQPETRERLYRSLRPRRGAREHIPVGRGEVLQEPIEQAHGVRDRVHGDPSGGLIRFSQTKA